MRLVSVHSDVAIVELSMSEIGSILNAVAQELGYQEPRQGPIDPDFRRDYDDLYGRLVDIARSMDKAAGFDRS
jgi:hypothetical protein